LKQLIPEFAHLRFDQLSAVMNGGSVEAHYTGREKRVRVTLSAVMNGGSVEALARLVAVCRFDSIIRRDERRLR